MTNLGILTVSNNGIIQVHEIVLMSSFDIFENFSGLFVARLEDFVEFEIFGLFWSKIF